MGVYSRYIGYIDITHGNLTRDYSTMPRLHLDAHTHTHHRAYSKGTLLGTPNREPQEYSRNIMEYKDPGRYIPIIYLLYSWGSLFGVPSRVPLYRVSTHLGKSLSAPVAILHEAWITEEGQIMPL